MAELSEVVRNCRMVRNLTSEPVADETPERIIATARRTASPGFGQGVVLITVTDDDGNEIHWPFPIGTPMPVAR